MSSYISSTSRCGEAQERAVEVHVLAPGELGVEPYAELDERHQPAFDGHRAPAVGCVDAGEDLEQRALAGTVAADDAEELAAPDVEVDVPQRVLQLDGPATRGSG